MSRKISRIVVTSGEPAGIGPDLIVQLAHMPRESELVVVGDPDLLRARADMLGARLRLVDYDLTKEATSPKPGELLIAPVSMDAACTAGVLDPANGQYVLRLLERAVTGCLSGEFDAMLTAPVQKSTIAESGTDFSGHTEYLAEQCGVDTPVMLLCADTLRVALLTTHCALAEVPSRVTATRISDICHVLATGLRNLFGIENPRIAVLGLNPHSGEAGQLGHEERDIIEPAIAKLRQENIDASGPLPADTAFTRASLQNYDAVLAMYHDQGLPVLKHASFGEAVNVTLGLPIIRTSVDHGTALDIAGTGKADSGSLLTALKMAEEIARRNSA